MVQLTNDCCSSGGKMQTLEEAHTLFRKQLHPIVGTKIVSVYDAVGYVLARDVISVVSVPAYDNSAVDGYAINADSLSSGDDTTYTMTGRVAAGDDKASYDNTSIVRIFTGAPVPVGFDTVIMQEDVDVDGAQITIPNAIKRGSNIRYCGEDVKANEVVLTKGTKLRSSEIAIIASQGMQNIEVYKKLKVGFFSSGDELLEVGSDINELAKGRVFDSNRPMTLSLLKEIGVEAVDLGKADDTIESVRAMLQKGAEQCDVMMSAGGMSVGEEDHIQAVLKEHAMDFWKLAIKPGKPVGFGLVHGTPFIGFPGNPVSVYVVFGLIGVLVLKLLGGQTDYTLPRIPVRLGFDVKTKIGRREFMRAVLVEQDGEIVAIKSGAQGSGVMRSVINATGLIEIAEDASTLGVGDLVNYIPFEGAYS